MKTNTVAALLLSLALVGCGDSDPAYWKAAEVLCKDNGGVKLLNNLMQTEVYCNNGAEFDWRSFDRALRKIIEEAKNVRLQGDI